MYLSSSRDKDLEKLGSLGLLEDPTELTGLHQSSVLSVPDRPHTTDDVPQGVPAGSARQASLQTLRGVDEKRTFRRTLLSPSIVSRLSTS